MWMNLVICIAVMAAFVYIPAYLALRAVNFHRVLALCFAPLVSLTVYSLEAIVYPTVGVECDWMSLATPFAAVAFVAFAIGALVRALRERRAEIDAAAQAPGRTRFEDSRSAAIRPSETITLGIEVNVAHMLAFLGAGIVCAFLFHVLPLGDAAAFICGNDSAHHINLIRAFLDTGNWSTLESTTTPGEGAAFYPSMWSMLAAMGASFWNVPVTVASNATNALVIGIIFPLCLYPFAARVLQGDSVAVYLCAILGFAFFGFPWEPFLRKTQLYPNALGFALTPAFLTACMCCLPKLDSITDERRRSARARAAASRTATDSTRKPEDAEGALSILKPSPIGIILALFGLVAICLAHPNTLFTSLVFLFGYGIHVIVRAFAASQFKGAGRVFAAIGACLAFTALFVGLWVALSHVSFMQSVITNPYDRSSSLSDAVIKLVALKSPHIGAQYPLAFLVLIGAARACVNHRYRWLLIPCLIMGGLFATNACLADCNLKHIISGFWYNHPTRLFISYSLFCMPLAALGAAQVVHFLEFAWSKLHKEKKEEPEETQRSGSHGNPRHAAFAPHLSTPAYVALAALMAAVVFALPLPLPYACDHKDLAHMMQEFNDPNDKTAFLNQDERGFLALVAEEVPDGERILNIPHDGSVYAYGLYDENVAMRDLYGTPNEELLVLTQHINDMAKDPEVARTAQSQGITYVLRLDGQKSKDSTIYQNRYDEATWAGIFAIDDETPGFEVALHEGDMYLFRLVSADVEAAANADATERTGDEGNADADAQGAKPAETEEEPEPQEAESEEVAPVEEEYVEEAPAEEAYVEEYYEEPYVEEYYEEEYYEEPYYE